LLCHKAISTNTNNGGDAPRELNGKYSKLTLVLYLSDNCKGGETFFDKYGLKINPTSGVALLFNQELNHEALIVTQGVKYVLRTNCFWIKQSLANSGTNTNNGGENSG
jgi:hypothetical protein